MKSLIIYLFSMLATVYILVMYNQPSLFILLLSQVMLLCCLFIITFISSRTVKVSLDTKELIISKNQPLSIKVNINNRLSLPYVLTIKYNDYFLNNSKIESLKSSTSAIDCLITTTYASVIKLSIETITFRDYLGIFTFKRKLNLTKDVIIKPNVHPVNINLADDDNYEIRDYREGDNKRQIHWKVTAKKDKLMVKETKNNENDLLHFYLYLNEKFQSSEQVDAFLDSLFSIANSLIKTQKRFLLSWDNKTYKIEDLNNLYSMMSLLPNNKTDSGVINHNIIGLTDQFDIFLNQKQIAHLDIADIQNSLQHLLE